jgi:hypothetical protein
MLNEIRYIFKVVVNKRHPKLIFRELVSHWNYVSSQWVVPNEIYYAMDDLNIDLATSLLNKQKELWGEDDLAITKAESHLWMLSNR